MVTFEQRFGGFYVEGNNFWRIKRLSLFSFNTLCKVNRWIVYSLFWNFYNTRTFNLSKKNHIFGIHANQIEEKPTTCRYSLQNYVISKEMRVIFFASFVSMAFRCRIVLPFLSLTSFLFPSIFFLFSRLSFAKFHHRSPLLPKGEQFQGIVWRFGWLTKRRIRNVESNEVEIQDSIWKWLKGKCKLHDRNLSRCNIWDMSSALSCYSLQTASFVPFCIVASSIVLLNWI